MKKSYDAAVILYLIMLLHENDLQDQAAHQCEQSRLARLKERQAASNEEGLEL